MLSLGHNELINKLGTEQNDIDFANDISKGISWDENHILINFSNIEIPGSGNGLAPNRQAISPESEMPQTINTI